jgi:hypothetical protein
MLCRVGDEDESGLERPLLDLRQSVLTHPTLGGDVVA